MWHPDATSYTPSPTERLRGSAQDWGALRRTIYAARYLADETYRRKIARQLNKGESLHALRRDLLYAHEGALRRRRLEIYCCILCYNLLDR